MKSQHKLLLLLGASFTMSVTSSAIAADLTWDGTVNSNWNTTDANWTSSTWGNTTPDNAIFITNTGTINLTEAITAHNVTFGLTNANTSGSFSGSALTINGNLTAQADNTNGSGVVTTSFSNNVSVGGDVVINRRVLEVTGGTFTANRISSTNAWGRLLISGGAVTATNGIDDSILGGGVAMNVFLQGGTLSTPYIKTTSATWTGLPDDGVVLNGGTLIATASSTDFIQTWDPGGWGVRNTVGVGPNGANIDTNGFDIAINRTLVNYGGSGTLTKNGAGKLTLNWSEHNGGTTVNAGTLEYAPGSGYSLLRGLLTVNSGATVSTLGDGTGLGWQGGSMVTTLTINGGTVTAPGTMHVWNISGGVNMTGGTLQSNGGVSNPNGPQLEWINSTVTTNASADTATIGGRIRMRGDGGAPGITFNVEDGAAATDLLVSAAITEAWDPGRSITKNGAGTMVLSGANNYTGSTNLNEGTLALTNPVLDDVASVIIANGAVMALNFTGSDLIGSLEIDGSGPLPADTYNASHPTYGTFFSGTGSLVVQGASGTWTSLVDGNWSDAANWLGNTVASGYDSTATFNAATGVAVTVDTSRKIGNLVFDVSDYSLVGAGTLSLDATSTPTISVTSGRTTTIAANLAGTKGMEKIGSGHLILTGIKSYTAGTVVTSGTLELAGSNSGNSLIRGALFIESGTTVSLTGGDGTGFGWNNPVTQISMDNGTLNAASGAHIGFGSFATISLENGSTVQGNWQWNGDGLLTFSSLGDTTNIISGNLVLRGDSGASHTFQVDDGASATDLQIDANLSDQWPEVWWVPASGLTKSGTGTLVLNGTNSYDGNTTVNDGVLNVTATSSLRFRPTTNGLSNSVSGTSTGSLSFLGTVSLDLTAADTTPGNSWNLFNLTSFTSSTPILNPSSVTSGLGSFTEVSAGVWELPVTDAKWVFTVASGDLTYVSLATDYDTWKTANGVTGGDNDDQDNDGVTNFAEYAFGLNPTSGSQVNAIAIPLDKAAGTFSYTRRTPSLTGLKYSVWYSTNLTSWTEDAGAVEGTPAVNGDVQTVPVTISSSLITNEKLFIRVVAD